jgi:hypothetical protein
MHLRKSKLTRLALTCTMAIGAIALVAPALAGPPLICHEIQIPDSAKSLPWGKDTFTKSSNYSQSDVVRDTLGILKPDVPVLVRMETLRRATLYIDHKQVLADDLLGSLMARAMDAEAAGKPDALAWFDAGYLVQCFYQTETPTSFSPGVTKGTGASSIAGYSWVAKAIALDNGAHPQMDIGAALLTCDYGAAEHEQHLKRAIASGAADSPEANDLMGWIAQINGTTIENLRSKFKVTDARSGG